jgi:asparagine synthase (glutamine-hydrolysing)
MPGIVGFISRGPATACENLARLMSASMQHESFYTLGTYSVPELGVYAGWVAHEGSFAASQPFFNETGDVVLLFSGECFTDPQARAALICKGRSLTKNPADWLVHRYEEEGDRFFENLNGVFSGLLIDKRLGKVFLFNDRYGVERIYWHEADGEFYFSSEAKALLRILPELREFDTDGVAQFLAFGCTLGTRTLFRGINILPGGSLWSFEEGRYRKRRYFSPQQWETQPALSAEGFESELEETFKRIVPRYFESESRIGISLTAGLDSRMIMACRREVNEKPICYTFSGSRGSTLDDRVAARVAAACDLEHKVLRVGSEFFSDFARLTDRTVYTTDGSLGATGAHEIYFNKQARQLAPVRLTGNYGSELFRGISTFKPLRLTPDLFEPEFASSLNSLAESMPFQNEHRVTLSAFREIPWNLFGSLAAARSQIVVRTPYLDNEMVALAYQNPEPSSRSPRTALRVIQKNDPVLGRISSDMGFRANDGRLLAAARYLFCRTTFKLDYANNEGLPNWFSPFDPVFKRVGFGMGILGLHKFLHYRSWFRQELASYVRDAVTNATSQQMPFWNPDFLKRLIHDHTTGRKNYVREINAVLTLDAVERMLFRGFADEIDGYTIRELQSHPRSRLEKHAIPRDPTRWMGYPITLSLKGISPRDSHHVNHPRKWKVVSANSGTATSCLPTFLGIGSMRCGSTWLYEVLKLHPDVRISDCKEVDFFFLPQMLQHDLNWYEAHFKPNNGSQPRPVRGEISPRYARLKPWQVNQIAELLPDLRIILTLRHPIERVWSQTLYDFGRLQGRDIRDVSSVEFLRQLERARNRLSSDYLRTIKIWSNAFGREALHVGLYQQLRDDPDAYVNGVLKHIGASTPWALPAEFTQERVWSTKSLVKHERDIPELVQWYIADQLLESTERLNELLEGRVSKWVEELRTIRSKTRSSWRLLKELNRIVLSMPERLAYEAYHAVLDVRLWRRWQQLQTSYLSGINFR